LNSVSGSAPIKIRNTIGYLRRAGHAGLLPRLPCYDKRRILVTAKLAIIAIATALTASLASPVLARTHYRLRSNDSPKSEEIYNTASRPDADPNSANATGGGSLGYNQMLLQH
jgi:hypothetical protein